MALQTPKKADFAADRTAILIRRLSMYRHFRPRFQQQSTGTFGTEIKGTPRAADIEASRIFKLAIR